MTGDVLHSPQPGQDKSDQNQSDGWLADNVLKPFANGTGLIQVYDTIADKPVSTYSVKAAPTFSGNWCAQTISGAAGAIIPYVVAGKVTGMGMRALGENLGLEGGAARFMASDTIAQIGGAGLYEFAQKPLAGQTRTGNAAGTMAGFAMFAGGEMALGKVGSTLASPVERTIARGGSRVAVGAVGGLGSYETTNLVSGMLGVKHQETWNERWQTMAQGGFVYLGLPVVQEGASKVMDHAIYGREGSKGLPIQREIKNNGLSDPELAGLVRDNALARVKRGAKNAQAEVAGNRVLLTPEDGAAKLAHEMTHLKLARAAEPIYKQLADLTRSDPEAAEQAYYRLRAEMEVTARQVENRVQDRAQSTESKTVAKAPAAVIADGANASATTGATARDASPAVTDLSKIGDEHAVDGKSYSQIWKGEWEQFKTNPDFRPPVEYGGIVKWTKKYENWMSDKIDVNKEDLNKKHLDMASDPFKFLRATYYRWAKMFPKVCDDLADAPKVKSVGDLHIDNFGTWRDKLHRLIWGVNDFDEAYKLPYTNDLVRLMTSANLARQQNHLQISLKDACDTVLEGYRQGLKDGGKPFVLNGRQNEKLAKIALGQMPEGPAYWQKLFDQISKKPESSVPTDAARAVQSILPGSHDSITWGHRQAGEGSLGRERHVGITSQNGANFAGEAKAQLPSANYFARGKNSGRSYYNSTIESAVRFSDPYVKAINGWIVRRLGPEHAKIELGDLPRVKDERRLLWAMGYETANIHLGTKDAAKNVLADLDNRGDNWLVKAVKDMTESTLDDHEKWKKHMGK